MHKKPIVFLFAVVATALLLATMACAKKEEPIPEVAPQPVASGPQKAMAKFLSHDGSIAGTVTFSETADGVAITAHVEGAPPGIHGFHIHEIGDCSADDFTSAGGHFNPSGAPHGGPSDAERHAGDLGNIEVDENGTGHLTLTSNLITVAAGPNSVIDRGVILHAAADDLVSQPTGDAGGRLACGVISRE